MTDTTSADIIALPKKYGNWTLETFVYQHPEYDSTIFSYQQTVSDETEFTVYVEDDGSGYGGALLDTGDPENPHRDAIDTFDADTFDEALEKAKEFMDRDMSRYYR